MGVTVEFSQSLAARTGTKRATVAVDGETSLLAVIDELAAEHGPQVRTGLLEAERLRSDTIAKREGDGIEQSICASDLVKDGDRLRFKLTSEHDKVTV